jgi:hypothetical protein
MAVKGFTGNLYTSKLEIVGLAGAIYNGMTNFQLQWQRPIQLTKLLDSDAPMLVKGRAQGRITLTGFATSAADSVMASTSAAFSGGVVAPALASFSLVSTPKNGVAATANYSGYLTGQGVNFVKLADRMWYMAGSMVISLVD